MTTLRLLGYLALAIGAALVAAAVAAERFGWSSGLTTGDFTIAAIVALALWWAAEFAQMVLRRTARAAQLRETSTLLAHLNNTTNSTGARR